jgi:hypothetical protein
MITLEKNEEQLKDSIMGKITLDKDKVRLEKHVVSLSKSIINLSKEADFDLGNTKARVVFALDDSGSMESMFKSGAVQDLLDKLVPLGLTFDSNGSIEVYRFSSSCKKLTDVDLSNYSSYVNNVMLPNAEFSGTEYSPVLEKIFFDDSESNNTKKKGKGFLSKLFGKKKSEESTETDNTGITEEKDLPTFVFFATDGDNYDRMETEKIIKKISKENGFIQFVGMGNDDFSFLEKLDDLPDRERDNTGFTKVEDIENIDDSKLYTILLGEFIKWLKNEQ